MYLSVLSRRSVFEIHLCEILATFLNLIFFFWVLLHSVVQNVKIVVTHYYVTVLLLFMHD